MAAGALSACSPETWPCLLNTSVACGVAAAVVLVALWIFARILRTLAVVLLAFCVVFLVLKVGFDVDLLQYICAARG